VAISKTGFTVIWPHEGSDNFMFEMPSENEVTATRHSTNQSYTYTLYDNEYVLAKPGSKTLISGLDGGFVLTGNTTMFYGALGLGSGWVYFNNVVGSPFDPPLDWSVQQGTGVIVATYNG